MTTAGLPPLPPMPPEPAAWAADSVPMGPLSHAPEIQLGMRFWGSVHAAHAWTWYELAQDYDGKLTKAGGAGKWWEGLDPQDLCAQNRRAIGMG